jgi:hypothetical protein
MNKFFLLAIRAQKTFTLTRAAPGLTKTLVANAIKSKQVLK